MDISTQMEHNLLFNHPFTWMIAGPSSSGKSTSILELLKNVGLLIVPKPKKMAIAYKHNQEIYDEMRKYIPSIILKEPGVPKLEDIQGVDLLIIDDLMDEIDQITTFFTVYSHHRNISVIFITQNLYERKQRTLSLNSHFLSVFGNPRDSSQIMTLAKQVNPDYPKLVMDAYRDARKTAHGYLLINCTQKCDEKYKFRNHVNPFKARFYVSHKVGSEE